jgi:nicotinamidase-related amidase
MDKNDLRKKKAVLLVIDMQKGFISEKSPLCIRMAAESIPYCVKAVEHARKAGIPVIWVRRQYAADGSDVDKARKAVWEKGGKPLLADSRGPVSDEFTDQLFPAEGERIITKPRYSAFFATELDLLLRRRGVDTVIITGTTTPNCVRTTCYDGLSLDYDVVIIPECCSSNTVEIQNANLEDMENAGAVIMPLKDFIKQ